MIEFEFDFVGYEEQMKRFERFAPIADQHLVSAMQKSTIEVQSAVRPLTPVFMGALRNSIQSQVKHEGPLNIVGVVGSTLKSEVYPSVMEHGRKPGTMPPPDALERWVHIKLGVSEKDAPGVALAVARKIKARGIPGHFFMKRGWEKSKPRVIGYFEQALRDIANALAIGGN